MINDELIKTLTYKEFKVFCNQRACDGRWSMLEAMAYLNIIDEIDKIKVKFLGLIPLKKKLILIEGAVFDYNGDITEEEFLDAFYEFLEDKGWYFGGLTREEADE